MADYGLAPVDYDPFAGDYGQGMSPDAFSQAGDYLRRAATGQIAANSPLLRDNYDPSKSFAQNATNPSGVANAANIAMGFSGGGLATKPAAAAAPAARTGLMRNGDLETFLPVADRRVGPYQPGVGTTPVAPVGADWPDLDMSQKMNGMKASPQDLQKAWDDAVAKVKSWSPEQSQALDEYLAANKDVGPNTHEFWNGALGQEQASRYWYELGARHFQNEGLTDPEDFKTAVNVAAATSPSAEPLQNLKRTIGVLAENQQGLPISTDLIQPGSVRMAMTTGLEGPKTGNYTNTFSHIAGADDHPPISVNDRQAAAIHNIDPEELAKNPGLYGLMSSFYQNLRDAENAARPGVAAGTENPFETWQLQAPAWTWQRALKTDNKAGAENFDDYRQVAENNIKPMLAANGVDTSQGLYSPAVLNDPRVPDLLSPARQKYIASPTATVETATTQTPEGRAATDLLGRLPSGSDAPSWANQARYGYESVQRNSMRALSSSGKSPSVISQLVAPLVGDPRAAVSRIDNTGWGTYQNDISPNMRIPMLANGKNGRQTLTPDQIHPLLSALGEAFQQDAVPASHFETLNPSQALTQPQTHSVFVPETGPNGSQTTLDQLKQFRSSMGDHEMSVSRAPNGTLIDIHPAFTDNGQVPPQLSQIQGAADAAFGSGKYATIDKNYTSHYIEQPDYEQNISNFWNGERNAALQALPHNDRGGVSSPRWSAEQRASDFEAARQKARDIAEQQRGATQQWIAKWQPRVEQYEQNPSPRGPKLKSLAVGGALGAGAAGTAQAAPYSLQPVDHNPFMPPPAQPARAPMGWF